jgi:DNA-binding transcriptional MerR regulator/effector-binding domain-containing protein
MSELLTIGDFSRMTFLTVKALRHYHEVGLLQPARIDEHSGYRYYRPEQLTTARLIRRLRDLDLPVEDVRTVLSAPDEQTRNAVIITHLERMSRQLQETQETVDSLRRMLSGGEQDVEVVHRIESGGWAVAVRGLVGGEEAVAWWLDAFRELHRFVRTSGAVRAGSDGATFPTEFFTEGSAEVLAFVPVTRPPAPTGRVEVVKLPGGRYAVATHDGPMVDLDGAYSVLGRFVTEQALAADGPIVERYLPLGPDHDLLHHRTEVCWPVTSVDGGGRSRTGL